MTKTDWRAGYYSRVSGEIMEPGRASTQTKGGLEVASQNRFSISSCSWIVEALGCCKLFEELSSLLPQPRGSTSFPPAMSHPAGHVPARVKHFWVSGKEFVFSLVLWPCCMFLTQLERTLPAVPLPAWFCGCPSDLASFWKTLEFVPVSRDPPTLTPTPTQDSTSTATSCTSLWLRSPCPHCQFIAPGSLPEHCKFLEGRDSILWIHLFPRLENFMAHCRCSVNVCWINAWTHSAFLHTLLSWWFVCMHTYFCLLSGQPRIFLF